jgi:CRP/FNR family transcriptional regulator, cyclic AMP receptor protein
MDRLIDYLKNNSLFDGISKEELSLITEQFQRVTYRKGETVFKEGDAGQSMFLLVSGQAGVVKDFFGGERNLGMLQPGEYFGEMSLLSGNNRSATVQAHTDLACYTINHPDFMALVGKIPMMKFLNSLTAIAAKIHVCHS